MIIQNIDKGNPFDWGKTSEDYAKYRDIYPQEFYDYILVLGLCKNGQTVLDIDTVHPVWVPDEYLQYFDLVSQNEFRVDVPFTRDSWHGRMRACRGVGASMSPADLESWDKEHYKMLEGAAPESFTVKHYVSIAELQKSERKGSVWTDHF